MKRKRDLIFIFVFLVSVGFVSAKNLYVDIQNISGPCSDIYTYAENNINQPYCLIQRAVNLANPGDIILLRGGIYPQYVRMGSAIGAPVNSGNSTHPITIKSFEGEEAIINYDDNFPSKNNDYMFYIHKVDYWIIDGLIFNSTRGYTPGLVGVRSLLQYYQVKNHIVRNCKFLGNDISHDQNGVVLMWGSWSSNILIENNYFGGYNCPNPNFSIAGIKVGEGINKGITIRNNTFYGLSSDGIHFNAAQGTPGENQIIMNILIENNTFKEKYYGYGEDGIDLKIAINATIRNNIISGFGYKSSGGGAGIKLGVEIESILENISIENNIIHDCIEGIIFGARNGPWKKIIIKNNLIYDIKKHDGEYGRALRLNKLTDSKIYNNTITYTPGNGIYFENIGNNFLNLEIKNNIFYEVDKMMHDNKDSITYKNKIDIGKNLFFNNNGILKFSYATSGNFNLFQLQTNLNQGIDSIDSDPLFVNPSNPIGPDGVLWTSDDGFIPKLDSPACGAGLNGGDIGAYSCATNQIPVTCVDNDHDGFNSTSSCGILDCNDTNPNIKPFAIENCSTSFDDNCNNQINENCILSNSLISYKTNSQIIIDGVLDSAWSNASYITFSNVNKSDNFVKIYSIYDSNSLYFAYEVTDNNIEAVNSALYQDDGAEIYLDTNNDKTTSMDLNDYGFIVNINNVSSNSNITGKTKITSNKYILEIKIPWTTINTIPSNGKIIGLLLGNNDRDNSISSQFDWMNLINTGSYSRPNLWGNLILNDSFQNQTCSDLDNDNHQSKICGGDDCNEKDSSTIECNPGDNDLNGCISSIELNNYIQRWYVSSSDVPMIKLANAIELWRLGGC